jgi:hypothetical protein
MKIKIHSIVDVITNSSTVIFTYQNSVKQAKELVQEVLNIAEIDKTPDDIFYYGVFCDEDTYFGNGKLPEDCPKTVGDYGSDERKECEKEQNKWLDDLKLSIMNGAEKPQWMIDVEEYCGEYGDGWCPETWLYIIPKEEKYKKLAVKIINLLCSVSADGGRDG